MRRRLMMIIDRKTGEMECKVCGNRQFPIIAPQYNRYFFQKSFPCFNKCTLEDLKIKEEQNE